MVLSTSSEHSPRQAPPPPSSVRAPFKIKANSLSSSNHPPLPYPRHLLPRRQEWNLIDWVHSCVVTPLPLRCSSAATFPGLGQAVEEARVAKPSVPGTNTHRPRLESTRAGPGASALHPASPLPLPGGREKKSAASPATSASLGGHPYGKPPCLGLLLTLPSYSKPGSPIKFCLGHELGDPRWWGGGLCVSSQMPGPGMRTDGRAHQAVPPPPSLRASKSSAARPAI